MAIWPIGYFVYWWICIGKSCTCSLRSRFFFLNYRLFNVDFFFWGRTKPLYMANHLSCQCITEVWPECLQNLSNSGFRLHKWLDLSTDQCSFLVCSNYSKVFIKLTNEGGFKLPFFFVIQCKHLLNRPPLDLSALSECSPFTWITKKRNKKLLLYKVSRCFL